MATAIVASAPKADGGRMRFATIAALCLGAGAVSAQQASAQGGEPNWRRNGQLDVPALCSGIGLHGSRV